MENKIYKCNICGKFCKSGGALAIHKKYCYIGKYNKIEKYPDNTCPYCKYKSTSKAGIVRHIRICNKNPNFDEDFYIKNYKNNKGAGWNRGLTKEDDIRIKNYGEKHHKALQEGKYQHNWTNKHHKNETKQLISNKRKEFLLNHPNDHPWKKSSKFISQPCEYLKEKLRKANIIFSEEYSPLDNRNFSIDIAFIDKKIGLEINGNQHYDKADNLLEYYQNRHDLIENSGWKLIEIHYYDVYKEDIIDKILEIIK